MENAIEVSSVDLKKLVRAAYDLSRPQGMGHLHFEVGGLDDFGSRIIIEQEEPDGYIAASMDYVKGRAVKLTVFRDGLWELRIQVTGHRCPTCGHWQKPGGPRK